MILANSNLSNLQSTFLLTSVVLLALIILSSFFLMIYNISDKSNKTILSSFWFSNFFISLVIFILIIFIFKDALNSYPCPMYISTKEDSTNQRDTISKAINLYQTNSNLSTGKSIQDYVSTRNYVVVSTDYLKKLNINTEVFEDLGFVPFAYLIDNSFYSLQGVLILTF